MTGSAFAPPPSGPGSAPRPAGAGAAASSAGSTLFERLAQRRLLVVSGKGGVGRTSVSALIGLALAERGRRVLVATTGHDDRLAWMLGAPELSTSPLTAAPGLDIVRLVPQVAVREYGALILRSSRLSGAVFDNAVVRRLLRAIPGLDDFAVIGKAWHEAVRERSYDCVIFDGPATGHLIYTLGVPQAILETVPKGPLTKEAELMQASFEDATLVEAVLVGLPELWPLTELAELETAIAERIKMSVAGVVVNGVWPDGLPELPTSPDMGMQVATVFERVTTMSIVGRRHRDAIERFSSRPSGALASRPSGAEVAGRAAGGAGALLEIPWCWQGLNTPTDLQALVRTLQSDVRDHAGGS